MVGKTDKEKQCRHLSGRLVVVEFLVMVLLSAGWVYADAPGFESYSSLPAAKSGSIATLSVGSGSGANEETVEISVHLDTNSSQVSGVQFWLEYDPESVSFVEAVEGPVALAAEKQVEANVPVPGEVRVIVYGLNDNIMADGLLATISFAVLNPAGAEVVLTGTNVAASTPEGESLDILMTGNCGAPGMPMNVSASSGDSDGILVTWSAADGANSYVVYRSDSADPMTSEPVSGRLGQVTSYLDTGAASPTVSGGGCTSPRVVEFTHYYYWVRALAAAASGGDLGSDLGGPAEGYRGGAKSSETKSLVGETALPATPLNRNVNWAEPISPLAVRLSSEGAIDIASIWCEVDGGAGVTYAAEWHPLSDNDGWVVCRPDGSWTPGAVVRIAAGADAVGPVEGAFMIQDFDESVAKAAGKALTPVDVPPCGNGIGDVYRIGPDALYDEPKQVLIPLPDGASIDGIVVYYYSKSPSLAGWHRAESVAGWLDGKVTFSEQDGEMCAVISVRHGGIVQLATESDAFMAASVVPFPGSLWGEIAGDAAIICLALMVLRIASVVGRRRLG